MKMQGHGTVNASMAKGKSCHHTSLIHINHRGTIRLELCIDAMHALFGTGYLLGKRTKWELPRFSPITKINIVAVQLAL